MGCPLFRSSITEEESAPPSKKKLVICGMEGSGKTTILNYLKDRQFTSPESTIGLVIYFNFVIFKLGLNIESITLFEKDFINI